MVPVWFQVIQALGLIAVAAFGAWIAYQQFHNAREKLRLDLFERRMHVFSALRDYLGVVFVEGLPSREASIAFEEALEQAHFLFGSDVIAYLLDIRAIGMRLTDYQRLIQHGVGERRDRAVEGDQADRETFRKVYDQMYDKFAPYLTFDSIRQSKYTLRQQLLLPPRESKTTDRR